MSPGNSSSVPNLPAAGSGPPGTSGAGPQPAADTVEPGPPGAGLTGAAGENGASPDPGLLEVTGAVDVAAAPRDAGAAILAPLGPPPTGRTFTFTVNLLGTGSGRVVSSPLGIDCPTRCSASFAEGTPIVLRARPENGSDSLFAGWSASVCQRSRDCYSAAISSDQRVDATFSPMPANVAFVNSDPLPTDLGSAGAYDAVCNASATRAGLNNLGGDRFVALMSDASQSARERLGSASGWMLLDGRPFAGSVEELFDEQRVYNPLNVTEMGVLAFNYPGVLTSSFADGTGGLSLDNNCDNFTTLEGSYRAGDVNGGPGAWIDAAVSGCGRKGGYIYCMARDRTVALEPPAAQGRRIWLSNEPFRPGEGTPDERCQAGLPPGVGNARALIARAGIIASTVLEPDADYVRPDGVFVGTGRDIASLHSLTSGIWQRADGAYVPLLNLFDTTLPSRVWTGSPELAIPGAPESTCNDWTSTEGSAFSGNHSVKHAFFWSDNTTRECGWPGGGYLYCVESAATP